MRGVRRERLNDVFLFVTTVARRRKRFDRREFRRLPFVADERLDVERPERERRTAVTRRLREAAALNRFARKRFRRDAGRRRSGARRRFLASRRRVVSLRVVGADRIRARVVAVTAAVIVRVTAVVTGVTVVTVRANGRFAFFAATADEVAAHIAGVAVGFRRTRRATAVRVNPFGQHRGGPMERRGRDVERAADERGEVVTGRATAKTAITVTGAAIRIATERRAAGRFAGRDVASRLASGGRNVANGSANGFASRGDRFANGRKFAVRGASAAVISEITGLTERRRRAQRRDRTDERQSFPIFFHFYLADKFFKIRGKGGNALFDGEKRENA